MRSVSWKKSVSEHLSEYNTHSHGTKRVVSPDNIDKMPQLRVNSPDSIDTVIPQLDVSGVSKKDSNRSKKSSDKSKKKKDKMSEKTVP